MKTSPEKLEWQRDYTRRRSLTRLAAVLADNFEAAFMLTFRYSGAKIAPAIARCQIRGIRMQAQRMAGGLFRYVQISMCEPSEAAAKPVFRLIAQLPADVCEKLAASWFMGPAEAEPMTAEQLAAFVAELMEQPSEAWPRRGLTWACSADLRQSRLYADPCLEHSGPAGNCGSFLAAP